MADQSLIKGAGDVAKAEGVLSFAGATGFAEGLTTSFKAVFEEKEKSKAIVNAFASSVKTPANITLLDEKNKPKILDFVRQKREEVVELAKAYAKTKDVNLLDEIQMKKSAIINLKNQINNYDEESKKYVIADGKNLIARGKNFEYQKHDLIWTKNSELQIEDDGSLGFTTEFGYDKYSDVTNTWNVNNNTYNTTLLKLDEGVYSNAQRGLSFDRTGTINNLKNFLSQQGPEEVQVALESNITGDDFYVIGQDDNGEDIVAENKSFEAMWSSGKMNSKFYKDFKPNKKGEYDSSWMFDDSNSSKAAELLSMYNADVLETRHTDNFVSNDDLNNGKDLLIDPDTYYRVGLGGRELGSDISSAYDKYISGDKFNTYDDRFTFNPGKDGSFTITGPTDPEKDNSFSGPITTRKIPESEVVKQMGFDKQADRLGFKGVKTKLPDTSDVDENKEDGLLKLIDKDIDENIFSQKAEDVLEKVLNSNLYENINFTNVTGIFGNKNKIEVFTTSGDNKIIINFGIEEEAARKKEMKKLNDFITKHKQ